MYQHQHQPHSRGDHASEWACSAEDPSSFLRKLKLARCQRPPTDFTGFHPQVFLFADTSHLGPFLPPSLHLLLSLRSAPRSRSYLLSCAGVRDLLKSPQRNLPTSPVVYELGASTPAVHLLHAAHLKPGH